MSSWSAPSGARRLALLVALAGAVLAGCSGDNKPAPTGTVTAAASPATPSSGWPQKVIFPYAQGAAPSPEFPATLPMWEMDSNWADTPRAFTGTAWTAVSGPNGEAFPSTMNGCDNQRFLVRWRAVNSTAQVAARWGQSGVNFGQPILANAGWLDLDGCARPEFQLQADPGGSTLTDVTVRVQRWTPAP